MITDDPQQSVEQLVTGLSAGDDEAFELLRQVARRVVTPLIDGLLQAGILEGDQSHWAEHTISWLLISIRTRATGDLQQISWRAFEELLRLSAARMLHAAVGSTDAGDRAPHPLNGSSAYPVRTLFLPHDRVGGDWFGEERMLDGGLWLNVSDICGKGLAAHLLARGLPLLWNASIIRLRRQASCQPVDLLGVLHDQIKDCLPYGQFVETLLARFDPSGCAAVSAAGHGRLIDKQADQPNVTLKQLGGSFLGIESGSLDRTQLEWKLETDEQVLFATDGLFDQPCGEMRLWDLFADLTVEDSDAGSLHATVVDMFAAAVADSVQLDDTAIVTVTYGQPDGDPDLPQAEVPSQPGCPCQQGLFDCTLLVARRQDGDTTAAEELHAKFNADVEAIAHYRLRWRDGREFDDACQTIWAHVLLQIRASKWSGRAPFCRWFRRVVSRAAIDFSRAADRDATSPLEEPSEPVAVEPPDSPLVDEEEREQQRKLLECIRRHLEDFEPEWQQTFRLRFFESPGLAIDKVVQRQGIHRRTVLYRLAKIKEHLRYECFEE